MYKLFLSDKMNDYIDQLIKEAEELKKDLSTGVKYGRYRYHSNPLGFALWKRHVLEVLRSFGESNPYYTDLIAVEKDFSASMPRTVFSFFLDTLNKARQFPPGGLSWPIPPVSHTSPAPELTKREPQTVSSVSETVRHSEQALYSSAQTTDELLAEATPEARKGVSLAEPDPQPGREKEKLKEGPSQKTFIQLDSEARGIYDRLLVGARELVIQSDKPSSVDYENIINLCSLTIETLRTNPVLITYAAFLCTENYLYAHTANVTVLSQAIALDYGLSQEDTSLLSFCAMVNDFGMTEFQELYSKWKYLNDSEFLRITRHVDAGITKLERITGMKPCFKERARKIIHQIHERVDASGYPLRLSGEKIDLLAQIIGIADSYEAMTHPRLWREAYHPSDAIKLLTGEGKRFELKVLKSLIRTLSVYPPSSLVELSSGEIVRVIMPRKGSLSRPLVEVLLGPDFAPSPTRILDLGEPLIRRTIVRPIPGGELEERNPKFAAHLESTRWWGSPPPTNPRSAMHTGHDPCK